MVYGPDGLTPTKSLTIPYGQTLILPWGMYGVNTWSCTINPGGITGTNSGSTFILPTNPAYPTVVGKTYTLSCRNNSNGQTSTDSITVKTLDGPTASIWAPIQAGVEYTNPFAGPPDWTVDLSQLNETTGLWLNWYVIQGPTIPSTTSCSFNGLPTYNYWAARRSQSAAGYTGDIFLHAVPTPSGLYGSSGVTTQSIYGTLPLITTGTQTYTISCTDSATGKTSSSNINLTFK